MQCIIYIDLQDTLSKVLVSAKKSWSRPVQYIFNWRFSFSIWHQEALLQICRRKKLSIADGTRCCICNIPSVYLKPSLWLTLTKYLIYYLFTTSESPSSFLAPWPFIFFQWFTGSIKIYSFSGIIFYNFYNPKISSLMW